MPLAKSREEKNLNALIPFRTAFKTLEGFISFHTVARPKTADKSPLVDIFHTQTDGAAAYRDLRSLNLRGENIIVLTPGASLQELDAVPTEGGEQPGMGKAIGSVIGGAMGLAGGVAVATLLLPAVGPVLALARMIAGRRTATEVPLWHRKILKISM